MKTESAKILHFENHKNNIGYMKILYVLGRGRSGSTLLEGLIEVKYQCFGGGELRLWDKALVKNTYCSCGNTLSSCGFWSEVFSGSEVDFNSELVLSSHARLYRWWNLLLLLLPWRSKIIGLMYSKEVEYIKHFYDLIEEHSKSDVIVDSSKNPFYCYFLSNIVKLDVYAVHMVRDPRAVAYSWQRQKSYDQSIPLYKSKVGIIPSSIKWLLSNAYAEIVKASIPRLVFVKYEEFTENVDDVLEDIGGRFDLLERQKNGKNSEQEFHSISGNPRRLLVGNNAVVSRDKQYLESMGVSDKVLVALLTLPLYLYYGYHR